MLPAPGHSRREDLQSFSKSFWTWRSYEQPFTTDDIPRIERPADFSVDWSAKTITRRRAELSQFEERWNRLIPAASAPVTERVDYRLLGSAIARVRWELDIVQSHSRNPLFYVDQTLGSVYVLLLPPPPFSPERARQLVARMSAIPATVQAAEENLTDMRQPFVRLAITALENLAERCRAMNEALSPQLSAADQEAFRSATNRAIRALKQFSAWLKDRVSAARQDTAVGRESYLYFLRNIALMPFSPERPAADQQARVEQDSGV